MSAPSSSSDQRWIPVARLLRPQGRRGELLAEPLTDLPEIFESGKQFHLASDADAASHAPSITLEECWRPQGRNAGRLVLKLAGVDSISAAETLETKELFVEESQLPALDADTFLVRDLVGCALFDGDHAVGTVVELQFPVGSDGRTRLSDAADLLVVELTGAAPESEPVLIPFVKAWLVSVDIEARRISMHLPPGLVDDASSPE